MEQALRQASPEATVEPQRSPEAAGELVVETIRTHADSLLRFARKHSLCADDAQDAYQRAMEIFMRRAATLDRQTAAGWLHTVVKHEAMAVRASRLQIVSSHDVDLDGREAGHLPSPEERLLSFDMVTRSAEALQRLKPQEVHALWLKAAGHSYAQIAERTGWTYTKVNRCIAEGRKSFLARYASIESGEECDRWAPVVSAMIDGEATPQQVIDARPHLRNCPACRAMMREADRQRASLAALFPVAAVGGSGQATAAASPGEPGGWLVRVYEAIAGAVHERAVASAVKVQAALDAATAGKVAAMAASAAAVAGGGVAVVDKAVVSDSSRSERAVAHSAPAAADDAVRAAAQHAKGGRPDGERRAVSPRAAPRRSAPAREFGSRSRESGSRQVAREFGSSPGREATASAASPASASASGPSARPRPSHRRLSPVEASGEFGP